VEGGRLLSRMSFCVCFVRFGVSEPHARTSLAQNAQRHPNRKGSDPGGFESRDEDKRPTDRARSCYGTLLCRGAGEGATSAESVVERPPLLFKGNSPVCMEKTNRRASRAHTRMPQTR
jgi:hypothetical protein